MTVNTLINAINTEIELNITVNTIEGESRFFYIPDAKAFADNERASLHKVFKHAKVTNISAYGHGEPDEDGMTKGIIEITGMEVE